MKDYQERIQLDRYAKKDHKASIQVGDLVVVSLERRFERDGELQESREIGIVRNVGQTYCVDLVNRDITEKEWEKIVDVERQRIDVLEEKSYDDICKRVSKGVVANEPDNTTFQENVYKFMVNEIFVPAGRILAGVGLDEYDLTLFNCYVFPPPHDSRRGIAAHWNLLFDTFSRGGGIGWDNSSHRPKGARVKKVNGRSSGAVSWIEQYSQITGAVEQGGCFAADTLISTTVGLIRADELADRIENGESIYAQTHKGHKRITAAFRNGEKDLYRVKTERGYTVEVSADHKMGIIKNGNIATKRLQELQVGDETLLLISRQRLEEYEQPKLIPVKYERSVMSTNLNTDVRLPNEMTPELAYLLGYSYGNGYVMQGKKVTWTGDKGLSLSVPKSRPEIIEMLKSCISETFGLNAETEEQAGEWVNIKIFSRLVIEWLRQNELLKQKSENIQLPNYFIETNRRLTGAFVSGYFDADGSDRKMKGGYGFDSISLNMLQPLQILLASFGIPSRINKQDRSKLGWKTIYRLTVTGAVFKQRMSKLLWMATKDDKHLNSKKDGSRYPIEVFSERKPKKKYYAGLVATTGPNVSYRALCRVQNRLKEGKEDTLANEYKEILQALPDKIKCIEKTKKGEVFDFEVADAHMLSGNGFYTSNSRRGAALAGLWCWHPDIEEFVCAKSLREEFKIEGHLVSRNKNLIKNANVSVLISDTFMEAVKNDKDWDLVFPDLNDPDYDEVWDGDIENWVEAGKKVEVYKTLKARDLWSLITQKAWESGEPGVLFMERARKMSNSYYYNKISCTNPCGEIQLPPWAVCNLGHINLSKFIRSDKLDSQFPETESNAEFANELFDWKLLAEVVRTGIRFLDNIVDLNKYHHEKMEKQQKSERRLGLGVLGYGELLVRLGLRYGSPEALKFTDELFKAFTTESYSTSVELAKERGSFPEFDANKFTQSNFVKTLPWDIVDTIKKNGIRNVTLNTVAPTGSVGTMLDTTTGLEPYFLPKWVARSRIGVAEESAGVFETLQRKYGEDIPSYFVTTKDITPQEHVKTQSTVQRWIDASISKTINIPKSATVKDVGDAYMLLYDSGCKGGTVYRDSSRDQQVLYYADDPSESIPVEVVTDDYKNTNGAELRPKIDAGLSVTLSQETPVDRVHGTIRFHPTTGEPYDMFITSGKGDVAADAQAIGRLISIILRWPDGQEFPQSRRLDIVREQLHRIPGRSQSGIGPQATVSMPDGISKIINRYLEGDYVLSALPMGIKQAEEVINASDGDVRDSFIEMMTPVPEKWAEPIIDEIPTQDEMENMHFDICPNCKDAGFVDIPGKCPYCVFCGFTHC